MLLASTMPSLLAGDISHPLAKVGPFVLVGDLYMLPASSTPSLLAGAEPTPLCTTVLAGANYTCHYANFMCHYKSFLAHYHA
jgi:hypothetical protein